MRSISFVAAALALGVAACNGAIIGGTTPGVTPPGVTTPGVTPPPPGPDVEPIPPANADVGRVGLHRLNNLEYDNTIHDLLGVTSMARATFVSDEKGPDFDNTADSLIVTDVRFDEYYNAADQIATQAFADPTLKARILTCAPASATDTACTRQIITRFGQRAWRRPLEAAEIDRLVRVATDAAALGE